MNKIVKLIVFLAVVSGLSGLCLSMVNNFTKPYIAKHGSAMETETLELLFEGSDTFNEMTTEQNGNILAVYQAEQAGTIKGYAYKISVVGYGGDIIYYVAISTDGTFVGYQVLEATNETSGIGSKVAEEPFSTSFIGEPIDTEIDTISGATKSSGPVISGIEEAVADFDANYKE